MSNWGFRCPDIENLSKDITMPTHEELGDMFSAEPHRQLQPRKEKKNRTKKIGMVDLGSELDQLDQYGRRDNMDKSLQDTATQWRLIPRHNQPTL